MWVRSSCSPLTYKLICAPPGEALSLLEGSHFPLLLVKPLAGEAACVLVPQTPRMLLKMPCVRGAGPGSAVPLPGWRNLSCKTWLGAFGSWDEADFVLLMGAHRGRVSQGSRLNQPGVHHPSSRQKSAGRLMSAPLHPTTLLPTQTPPAASPSPAVTRGAQAVPLTGAEMCSLTDGWPPGLPAPPGTRGGWDAGPSPAMVGRSTSPVASCKRTTLGALVRPASGEALVPSQDSKDQGTASLKTSRSL